MNMMNTRSEIRFVRKDIAIAVALVLSSLGTAELVFAQSEAGAVASADVVPDTVGSISSSRQVNLFPQFCGNQLSTASSFKQLAGMVL
ncbi:MAG: hypothetical protein ACI9US_004362 [Gammaproteobacteria bacterium]|jgi:hypothetical protein